MSLHWPLSNNRRGSAEIIIAIIGVETLYGQKTGNYRVIDALSTLAFAYPPRSKFFLGELESYLLLCRDEGIKPLEPVAHTPAQWECHNLCPAVSGPMPLILITIATGISGTQRDVIASVANYFVKHQWQTGQAIAIPVSATGESYKTALTRILSRT